MGIGQNINKQLKVIIVSISLILVAIFVYAILKSTSVELVSARDFANVLKESKIEKIYIQDDYVIAESEDGKYKTLTSGLNLNKIYAKYPVARYKSSNKTFTVLAVFLLLLILITLILMINKKTPVEKEKKVLSDENKIESEDIKPQIITNRGVNFKSIAGIEHAVDDLKEIVDFIKQPDIYHEAKIKMPKGLLLIGPPGVGKTMIAKAIANEANVPLFYQSGASFVQIYAGMGAKKVKELFAEAKKLAPSIIFIDEIDALGKSRELFNSDEREATLNQLLVEMDGFEENENILVIGATNMVDILDTALLRPGRFDRHIHIELPNIQDREKIIKLYLQGKIHAIDVKRVAKLTSGFSPASLEILINEASLHAFRNDKSTIEMSDIEAVKDRVKYGKRKVQLLSNKEREIKAFSEASKAVTALWMGYRYDKVSLLISFNINKTSELFSKDSLLDEIKILLSGYYYLQSRFNNIYSISLDDIKRSKELLKIVDDFLFEDEFIDDESIKEDVNSLLSSLTKAIDIVAKDLLEKESLTYEEVKSRVDEIF